MKPVFFPTPADLRRWFQENHATAPELPLGYYKKASGKPSVTWEESVAEALCFGWIDGIRRRRDDQSYTIRFTPRRKGSKWSAVNVRLMAQLEATGKMTPAGRAAFAARPDPQSKGYTAQKKIGKLSPALLRAFKKNANAWAFFEAQPPGYKKSVAWWVNSAKQEETRDRRFQRLLALSAARKRVT